MIIAIAMNISDHTALKKCCMYVLHILHGHTVKPPNSEHPK